MRVTGNTAESKLSLSVERGEGEKNQAQVTGNTTGLEPCLIMIQTSIFGNGCWENSFTLNVWEGRGEEGNIPVSRKK